MVKIVPEVLEVFEETGLSRKEGERIILERIGELSPEKRREELDFLGKSLRLSVKPISGSVNTNFVFTVAGHDPRKKVKIYVLKGRTVYWDPVIGTIPPGENSIKIKGGQITPHIAWIMTKVSPSAKAQIYASQKGWIFYKRSNRVILTIQKPLPVVGRVPLPGMEHGMTFRDILPAPPPSPPLPYFIVRAIFERFRRK